MFSKAVFREILLPLWDNVNDYVAHNYRKYADLDRNNRPCGAG